MEVTKSKFDQWCIVELFGHQKVAGHCTEENIAGTNFLRVDIPETKKQGALTKYYGASAIYAISPTDETTARLAAAGLEVAPVTAWQGDTFVEKFLASRPALDGSSEIEIDMLNDDDDEDDDEGYQTTARSEGGVN